MSKGSNKFYRDEIPVEILQMEQEEEIFKSDKKHVISAYVTISGEKYWKAKNLKGGIYYTKSEGDPKILNLAGDEVKGRGYKGMWEEGGINRTGRPANGTNKIDVRTACSMLGAYPAEFLVGVMSGNAEVLRKYRVKNPNEITVGQKIKSAQILIDKLEGGAKATERDEEGRIISQASSESTNTLQIFLEAPKQEIKQIQDEGVDNYLKRSDVEYEAEYETV